MTGLDKIKYLNGLTNDRACVMVIGVGMEMEELADAIVGISEDERAIHDYDKLVDCFAKRDGITREQAIEWVDYNVVRAIPYMGPGAPIVMNKIPEEF